MNDTSAVVRAQQANAKALSEAQAAPKTTVQPKKYYQPYMASFIVAPDGRKLIFASGCLEVTTQEDIDFIEDAIKSGAEISRTPVAVIQTDSMLLRDVGGAKGGVRTTGAMSSASIASLAAESNTK